MTKISREGWQSMSLEPYWKKTSKASCSGETSFFWELILVWIRENHFNFFFYFLFFSINCPLPSLQDFFCACLPQRQRSGSDCQGLQSCANPVLDLVKLLWTKYISDFSVNIHFSKKLSNPLHIPEVSSAHTNTPMHTDNARVLIQYSLERAIFRCTEVYYEQWKIK